MHRGSLKSDGFILVTVLSMAVLMVIILVVASTFALSARQSVTAEAQKIPAFYAANAGLERSMARINALIYPGQTIGTTTQLYRDAPVADVAKDLAARLSSTSNLATSDGSVSGGTFRVAATWTGGATVALKSEGTGTAGGKRTILLSYIINASSLKASAGAAVTSTGGATLSGQATVNGLTGAVATTGFTIACSVTTGNNCNSQSSPRVYSVTVPSTGQPLPVVGDNITYQPNTTDPSYAMGDALYKVTKVDTATRTVELTAINETVNVSTGSGSSKKVTATDVPLTAGAKLATTTEVAALLAYNGSNTNGSNTSGSCAAYACGSLSTDPSKLFEATFGVTKDQFQTDLHDPLLDAHRFLTTDECSSVSGGSTVQWLTPAFNSSGTINLKDCNTPRILIINAPDMKNGITLDLNNGVFRGLLYVIGNNQTVNIAGNAGSFDGAVIVETGTNSGSNPTFTVSGNGKTNICPNGAASDPKICYDPAALAAIIAGLKANLDSSALPQMRDLANSWAEKGN